jgi:3',5'-nucleoside bisphosphate phosphatase
VTPVDLHVHSAFSDGLLSPEALCALALQRRVTALALCDHDTVDGLAPMEAAAALCNRSERRLTAIPGMELSAGVDGRTHILGYGVNAAHPALLMALREIRRKRKLRNEEMTESLRRLGIELPPGTLPDGDAAGMPVGRPHVARALVKAGAVQSVEQAFDRYLGEGKPAYVPLTHMTAAQAVGLLLEAGAVPVLAHPARTGLPSQLLEALVQTLQNEGLRGLEVYHPSASRREIRSLDALARRRGLLVTGGSDFHGDRGAYATIGGVPDGWHAWETDLAALSGAVAVACTART